MAPFRMPFSTRKGPITNGLEPNNDENARPGSNGVAIGKDSLALGSKSVKDEPNEYKMSGQSLKQIQPPTGQLALSIGVETDKSSVAVNDSGIYLPVRLRLMLIICRFN
jgi:hypothetical protein